MYPLTVEEGTPLSLAIERGGLPDVDEDEQAGLEDDMQKLTDKYIENIDKAVESKTKEIMTV